MNRIYIVTPCYYDVISFLELRKRILLQQSLQNRQLRFVLVDDSSGQDKDLPTALGLPDVEVLTVPYNLGHQTAIVCALRNLAHRIDDFDLIVTMDADGEDCPEHITRLLAPLDNDQSCFNKVVLANRTRRQESIAFKFCYFFFKLLFVMLTGTVIRTGNFAAFRGWFAKNVASHPFFDYCYSSSLLALAPNISHVPLPRGTRYFGRSKMTFLKLAAHGLRMLLPFSETIAIRAIMIGTGCSFATIFGAFLAYMLGWVSSLLIPAIVAISLGLCFIFTTTAMVFFQLTNQTRALTVRQLSLTRTAARQKQSSVVD